MTFSVLLASTMLATLTIWDYPARQPQHDALRAQFIAAMRSGDTKTMTETCRKGVELLPDDPTWHYNLACSLAYFKDQEKALDELEKAIDLGFRNPEAIANDNDLKRLSGNRRFKELIEYADTIKRRPILTGPMASFPANGIFGHQITLGAHNLAWDFDSGAFDAKMKLDVGERKTHTGELYMNRDGGHSMLAVTNYPGLTLVKLDQEGRSKGMDLDFPNMIFPYPAYGNASRGWTQGPYWRSLPRALMTIEARRMKTMQKLYLSNQIWVFPSVNDCNTATNWYGDVFASQSPYWIVSDGISWSDQYYLKAALAVSAAMRSDVKADAVKRAIFAPTVMTIIRKSLKTVKSDGDYLTAAAHPTAFPPNGLDMDRLKKLACELKSSSIPPLAAIAQVVPGKGAGETAWPELTYASLCSWAWVLRTDANERVFTIKAAGAAEFAFAAVHGNPGAAKVVKTAPDTAVVTLDRTKMDVTNRVDIAVFGRNPGTDWGAPGYVSFAVVDSKAKYSDPVLTPLGAPEEEDGD